MQDRANLRTRVLRHKKTAGLAGCLLVVVLLWGHSAYRIDPSMTIHEPAKRPAEEARELIESLRSATGFQGAIIYAEDGEVVWEGGYGIGIEPGTAFSIGSLSKQFTGLLFAELATSGEVRLSDRVSKYVPESSGS